MKKIILCLIICAMITNKLDIVAFENSWESSYTYADNSPKIYTITEDYAPVRTEANKYSELISHFAKGQYISATTVQNGYGNTWLEFSDISGNKQYIFINNVEEHTIHCWKEVCKTDVGTISVCDCGYTKCDYYYNDDADCSFDGIEWLHQLILGNYTDTEYMSASILNIILGFTPVGTVCDIRDITADIVNADGASLVVDMFALIPLLDGLKIADDAAGVKYLASFDLEKRLIADDYDFLKASWKGVNEGIEIHHLVEKRLAVCFDVLPDQMLAIPLEVAEHRIITKRFRDVIPYNLNYGIDVTYDDMVSAVKYVYSDNEQIQTTVLAWVDEHWIGEKW